MLQHQLFQGFNDGPFEHWNAKVLPSVFIQHIKSNQQLKQDTFTQALKYEIKFRDKRAVQKRVLVAACCVCVCALSLHAQSARGWSRLVCAGQ